VQGLTPAQVAALLDCHPATVRRWIGRFNDEGLASLADRPRSGRPRIGGRRLTARIRALLGRPGCWTLPKIRRSLGYPQVSMRTLYRRVRLVAIWRRPKLTARGDPYHDHVVAGVMARLLELPRKAVVLAEDETHPHLLPHVRASWTLRTRRPHIMTPGKNRQVTVYGAIDVTTGQCICRLGRRCAADFVALLDQVLAAFPLAPAIAVICDNDSIHHARAVTRHLQQHPRLQVLYGARCSPHDNPIERIWGALKNYVADTAVTWPARLRQIHAFFRTRSPDQMPGTAAPWTSPWLPPRYEQNFWNDA
jgi:transposase